MNKNIRRFETTLTILLMGANAMPSEQMKVHPKTLFEIVGAQQPEATWKDSVLIIIDAQREYETGVLALPRVNSTVAVIRSLLAEARKRGAPIIHVVHEGQKGLFDPASVGFLSISEVKPEPGEIVIRKHLPNAFSGTDLQAAIEKLGANKKLIVTGFMTHMCISATAMAALDRSYETFVVRDAVATRALKGPDGSTISETQINDASLAALKDRISWIIDSTELLQR